MVTVKEAERQLEVAFSRDEQKNASNTSYHANLQLYWSRSRWTCAFLCLCYWNLYLRVRCLRKCIQSSQRFKFLTCWSRHTCSSFNMCSDTFCLSPYSPHPYRPCQTQRATQSGRAYDEASHKLGLGRDNREHWRSPIHSRYPKRTSHLAGGSLFCCVFAIIMALAAKHMQPNQLV